MEEKQQIETKDKKRIVMPLMIITAIAAVVIGSYYVVAYLVTDSGITPIEDIAYQESIDARHKAYYSVDRDSYGSGKMGEKTFAIKEIFKELPAIPEDFYSVKGDIMAGRATAQHLCQIEGAYYLQPEFYRNNFIDSGLKFYKNPDPTHWTPEGYGTYPSKMEMMSQPGSTQKICTFFHSSWGVETYQGLGLKVVYPNEASYNGVYYPFNRTESQKYITAKITPDAVLLSPAYLIFKPGWSKMINMTVSVAPETPPGMYAIGFDVSQAPIDKASMWYAEHKSNYQGKSNLGISEPQFTMVIKID